MTRTIFYTFSIMVLFSFKTERVELFLENEKELFLNYAELKFRKKCCKKDTIKYTLPVYFLVASPCFNITNFKDQSYKKLLTPSYIYEDQSKKRILSARVFFYKTDSSIYGYFYNHHILQCFCKNKNMEKGVNPEIPLTILLHYSVSEAYNIDRYPNLKFLKTKDNKILICDFLTTSFELNQFRNFKICTIDKFNGNYDRIEKTKQKEK